MITKYEEYIKESLSTRNDIKNWLDAMGIIRYRNINDDLTVDVDGDVNIRYRNLKEIPIKFNKVRGNFNCSYNYLTSLEGCPTTVNINFYCYSNKLTSLEGCPTTVNGDFYCHDNELTSLEYCPTTIKGNFSCYDNKLKDINDLDSKILIKNIRYIRVSEEVFDKYFEFWIDKDSNILSVLKNKVSDNIKQKYNYLFNANNFDLI